MPSSPLRLLYIEDDEGLASLLKRHLRRQNIDVTLAPDGTRGKHLCKKGGFDAILMDYNLPDISGMDLLNFCIGCNDQVPVIVLTALGDETIAVDAVRAGAADYLVKDIGQAYLELLPLVVRSAISKLRLEQRSTQQQKAIELSESMFRQIASAIEQVFWILERDPYRLIYVSPAFEDIWGFPVTELYDRPARWVAAIHEDDRRAAQEAFQQFVSHPEGGYDIEFRVIRPDGEQRWVRDRGAPVYDESGAIHRLSGIAEDITERRQVEQAIRAGEERLRLATEAAQIGTFDYNLVTDELQWDARTREIFGVPPDATISYEDAFLPLLHPDDRDRLDETVQALLRGEAQDFDAEYRIIGLQDGIERWVHAVGRIIFDTHEGKERPARFVGTVRDISAAKRALRKAEFMAGLEIAVREMDEPQKVMETFTQRLGSFLVVDRCAYATVEEDEEHFTILHDWTDDVESTRGHYLLSAFGSRVAADMQAGRTLVIGDIDQEKDSGAETFKSIGIRAIICCPLTKQGRLTAMMAVHASTPRDWTPDEVQLVENVVQQSWSYIERARAEQAVRKSEGEFRQLANAMPQMIWVAQANGYHEYYNQRWYDYTGVPEGSSDGEAWNGIFHPDDQERAWARWKHSLKTGEPYMIEYRLRRADGQYRWVLGLARAIRNEQGEITKWYGSCTDIHDKIMLERELVEAKERAEEANQAKSEFLANMSHEIRTPMNAVIGLANILAGSEGLSDRHREYVQTMQVSAQTLLALINDLLDIAKIEARTFDLESIPFNLARIIDEIVTIASMQARDKGLRFGADHEAVEHLTLLGDPARIRQILLNLCSNAIKFTEKGEVFLSVQATQETQAGEDIADIHISVADTGIGIPPGHLQQIFEKFSQADASINRKYGGTGLGLAITRSLTNMMGGSITVDSTEHIGSTFTVHLPLPVAEAAEPPPTPSLPEHQPMTGRPLLLLVEDYQPNILVATAFLEEFGYDCDTATNGRLAVEKVRERDYAAILMDVQMHEMNGFDATRAIRKWEEEQSRSRIPVIGMTAHALMGDREKCIEAGMDDYITKPFNPSELEDMLRRYAQPKAA